MKTFYLGCKINTNIPSEELFFAIKIYNSNTKKYILDMKPVKLSSSNEAHQVFIYQTSVDQARKHQVWLYIYRSWHSSEYKLIADRNIGSLSTFNKPENFKKLTPMQVNQSTNNNQRVKNAQPIPTMRLAISRRNIFVTPEYPSESPNDPFRKRQIEQELTDRIQGEDLS